MNEAAIETGQIITVAQKQVALEAVLQSNTFARADQLKSFLKFVCEMELSGRGAELSEYLIGVEALGRSPNYSPGDDSVVRNRAFALRKKLLEYYEHENPDAPLRIELTKGSYCPHFVEQHALPLPKANELEPLEVTFAPLSLPPASAEFAPPPVIAKNLFPAFLAGVVCAGLCAGVFYFLLREPSSASHATALAPILIEAWGPLLAPNADVLICIANPPSLSIHPEPGLFSNDPTVHRAAPDLEAWIRPKFRAITEQDLVLSVTTNGTYWGDSLGAMAALKILTSAGSSAHILPEKVTTMPTLRQRNVILFGAPEYSPAITHFLEKCPLTVHYLNAIVSRASASEPTSPYVIKRDAQFRTIEVYGLITILPSESSTGDQHRTVIFSGLNSAGAQAAAEFFSSPENLLELQKQLQKEGYDHFPSAYQVVVKAEPDDNLLLNFKYETHRVISTPTSH